MSDLSYNGRRRLKKKLFEQQSGFCAYCDEPMTWVQSPRLATLDEIIPRSVGGSVDETNCVLACHQCNRMKGCMTAAQIRKLAERVEKLTAWAFAQHVASEKLRRAGL